jgi:membrane-bound serine protease (ClpP class)
MNPVRTLILALLILLAALPAHAAGTVVISVRGTLDRDLAERVSAEMKSAIDGGAETLLLDFELSGAPESGLFLAQAIEEATAKTRVAAWLRGGAPGSGLAAVLACRPVYADAGARLGPIPKRGAVHNRVAALLRDRKVEPAVLNLLLPKTEGENGITAVDARERGIVDRVLDDPSSVFPELGVDPGEIETPEITIAPGRRRVTGRFTRPFLIPFKGPIDDTRATSVKRRVEEAKAAGADLIIFEIDSPGGTVSASLDAGDLVYSLDVPTVMLILEDAISGAALFALAGDEIVMGASGTIGDCQPISVGPDGITVIGEKLQSPLRATFRKYAEKNGYPTAVAEAMVTQEMQVDRVTFADGTVLYLTPDQHERHIAEHGAIVDTVEAVKKDQLLTMHGEEARELGFCGELVADRDAAFARFGLTEADVTVLDETWAETTSRFLLGLKFLLFIVGIMALYMELKAPGFGIPGALAIVCFALFFSASAIAGIATELEVILFLLGVGLLALEVLVIPGFGVPGLAGVGLIIASLYMSSIKFGLPSSDRPWEVEGFLDWLLAFGGSVIASVLGMVVIARILPHTAIGRKLILAPEGPAGSMGLTATGSGRITEIAALAGKTGTAVSDLRPAGRIEIDDEPWDAVTEGDFVESGAEITVIEVRGNRIVVKGIEK